MRSTASRHLAGSTGRGSIRIAGASTTSAPRPRAGAASPLAWARARVTATRGRAVGGARTRGGARAAPPTGPTRVTAGGRMPASRTRSAMSREGGEHGALAGQRAALDHGHGLVRVAPAREQALGQQRQGPHPHVEDERAREGGERRPVQARLPLVRILVGRDQGHGRGAFTVRHRYARIGGGGHARGHPRDDLEGDARRREHLGLLAPATEDEGVPALQPHDVLARPGELDEEVVHVLLEARATGALAHVVELDAGPRTVKGAGGDEPVVDDRVGPREQLRPAARHEPRVARPGTHEVDRARHEGSVVAGSAAAGVRHDGGRWRWRSCRSSGAASIPPRWPPSATATDAWGGRSRASRAGAADHGRARRRRR